MTKVLKLVRPRESMSKVKERLYTLECGGLTADKPFETVHFQPDKLFRPNRILCWGVSPCGLKSLSIDLEEQFVPLDSGMVHDMRPWLSPFSREQVAQLVAQNLLGSALAQQGKPFLYLPSVEVGHRVVFSGIHGIETIALLGVEPE